MLSKRCENVPPKGRGGELATFEVIMADEQPSSAQPAPGQALPDFLQLWRDWLTESERQFNSLMNQVMSADASARGMGTSVEAYAAFQRVLADGMQRYLAFVNMPSRTDVLGLGEALRSIEERLARIEETLQIAAEAVDMRERDMLTPSEEPSRTRRPPSFLDDVAGAPAAPVPEELRR
jgi:hypothetical protein